MTTRTDLSQLSAVASRIREMREIMGWTPEEMAEKTEVTLAEYLDYEAGQTDMPFTFIYKSAQAFNMELTELLEGHNAFLSTYTVTRRGKGETTAKEEGIAISNLAPKFRDKVAEPYWVRYEYSEKQQNEPIHTTTHKGQEFDLVLSGSLKVQVGDHTEILEEGDSIYYNSSLPHGMIAVNGKDCVFLAMILPVEGQQAGADFAAVPKAAKYEGHLVAEKFIDAKEDEQGRLTSISFPNQETFNFGFDIVDEIARKYPDKLAMLYVDKHHEERRFTFKDVKDASNQCANYFTSLGIKRGDRVMLVLKRHYQFWFSMVALHKLGAIAIPATNQLKEHDFEYRFNAAGVKALICTADGDTAEIAERAAAKCPSVETLIMVNGSREGWHNMNEEYPLFTRRYRRPEGASCGSEPALMFFTSGTTGNPKMAQHRHTYALGHYVTAKYWHCCERDGLHFTISDTGWGKSLWGKLYGQWLCEGAVFVYDFDKFDAADILPMFKKYNITTFCAIHHMTTAGEALNPEVYRQFEKATGLQIMEGFGQTETTLTIGNLAGTVPKIGSMGKANPQYDVDIVDPDGNPVANGEVGEIVIHTDKQIPCGLYREYYLDEERTKEAWHDGMYHTGDTAWRDEDGYFWYVSRIDDVIKSSGYRIGPFEIESVIMELPYVLECGVSAEPDEVRGQIVKASIVLTKGTEGTEELKKEIQQYVKDHTAPYKYPRKIVFRDELPKTISGKIQRNLL